MSLALALLLAAQDAEPIIITGRGLEEEESSSPAISISGEQARRAASGRLEESIEAVPGLSGFRRSDGRSSHPTSEGMTMRGLGGNAAARAALIVDGVPQADPFGGWINFSAIPLASVERMRISRGGGVGAALGPGALAGAVRIDTLDGEALGSSAFIGSNDGLHLGARLGVPVGGARLVAAGGWQKGDGFAPIVAEDRGPADRSAPYDQKAGRLRLIAPLGGGGSLQANLSAFDDARDRGFDGSDNEASGTDLSLRYVAPRWSLTAYWQDRDFLTRFAALDDDRAATRLVLDQRVPSNGVGAAVAVDGGGGAFGWRIGADTRRVDGRTNERYFFIDGEPTRARRAGGASWTRGAYMLGEVGLGTATLEADMRIDHWRTDDGFRVERQLSGGILTDENYADRSGWQPSAKLGISAPLGDGLAARALVSRSWRLPTLNEFFRPFRVGGDATAANPELRPEEALGAEAGLDWRRGPVSLSATFFAMRLGDAIANVPLGSGPGVFPDVGFVRGTYAQRRNLDAISSEGAELDLRWEKGSWSASIGYAFNDARIHATGGQAALDGLRPAQSPRHEASGSLGWDGEAGIAGLMLRYSGARYETVGNDIRLGDALTLDASGLLNLSRNIALSGRIENLTGALVLARTDEAGTRERARPRTIWIGITVR